MSTRSRVGIVNDDGTISSIYVHFDGYWGGVGLCLLKHYKSKKKVRALIELGRASSLESTIKKTKKEMRCDDGLASSHSTIEQYYEDAKKSWGEYIYLFRNGQWFATETYGELARLTGRENEIIWCRLKLD